MKRNYFQEIFITIILVLLMFQRILAQSISLFAYYDEFVMLVFVVLSLPKIIKRKKVIVDDIVMFFLIFLMILCGLIGNWSSGYNRSLSLKLDAILFWFKSFITFICAFSYFKISNYNTNNIVKNLAKVTKFVVIISFILLVISPVTKYGTSFSMASTRYGIHSYTFIYPTAAIFSWYCILYLMILTLDSAISKKSNFWFLVLTCVVWFFTLRSRAFAFIAIYWVMYLLLFKVSKEKLPKIKKVYVIFLLLLTLAISYPAIEKYFVNANTSRAILLKTGITIGKEHFPFGVGFANYGSSAAYKNYSNVYYYYGFNRIYALRNSGGSNDLTDTYWPSVIAEMGFAGAILLVYFLVHMYKRLLKKTKNNKWLYLCALFFMFTSIFSSIATAVFSADIMIAYVLVATIACYVEGEQIEYDKVKK